MTIDNNFKDLKSILNSILRKTEGAPHQEQYRIWDIWNEVVGPHIAKRARPETVRKGVLIINVISSVWMQELGFMKGEILERIQQRLGFSVINDIRFRLGQTSQGKDIEELAELPELDREEQEKIEQQTAPIKDQEIRESLQNLFTLNLRTNKKKQAGS